MIPSQIIMDGDVPADTCLVLVLHDDGTVSARCAVPLTSGSITPQEMAESLAAKLPGVVHTIFLRPQNGALEVVAQARKKG